MSGRIDLSSPTANMFGIEPCPRCGSEYRVPEGDDYMINCHDCGFSEPEVSERADARRARIAELWPKRVG